MVTETLQNIDDMRDAFSIRIKTLRETRFQPKDGKKPTQDRFAAAIGVSLETVRGWEQGKTIPEVSRLLQLAKFFDVDIDYLVGRINSSTHDILFMQEKLGLSEDAIRKLMSWNEDLTSNDLDTRHWIRFISEMIEDDSAETFLEKLHSGILNELQTQPIGDGGIYSMIQAEQPAAFHDATLFALSRISSDIVERIIKNALSRAKKEITRNHT